MANLFRPTNAEKAAAVEIYRSSGSATAVQRTGWTKRSILAWVREADAGTDSNAIDRPDWSWRENAACAGAPPGWFFVEPGNRSREAKALCAVCPVQSECLEYALVMRESDGVWGGMTYKERLELRRARESRVA